MNTLRMVALLLGLGAVCQVQASVETKDAKAAGAELKKGQKPAELIWLLGKEALGKSELNNALVCAYALDRRKIDPDAGKLAQDIYFGLSDAYRESKNWANVYAFFRLGIEAYPKLFSDFSRLDLICLQSEIGDLDFTLSYNDAISAEADRAYEAFSRDPRRNPNWLKEGLAGFAEDLKKLQAALREEAAQKTVDAEPIGDSAIAIPCVIL